MFQNGAVPNPAKSLEAGRPIFDDREEVIIRIPGSRDVKVFPAHTLSTGWEIDPETGEQHQITYAERYPAQYRQFKEHAAQMMGGTPLSYAPFLTEARRSELRALNIYTVEALAIIDGQELKNLGQGGRELKNSAENYIAATKNRAADSKAQEEIEALRAKVTMLESDSKRMGAIIEENKQRMAPDAEPALQTTPYDAMTVDQLREYIQSKTGFPVHGNGLSRKVLIRMAAEATAALSSRTEDR